MDVDAQLMRRIFAGLMALAVTALVIELTLVGDSDAVGKLKLQLPSIPLLHSKPKLPPLENARPAWTDDENLALLEDSHPIRGLMEDAARSFREYDGARSTTFAQAVQKYRAKYGRHPPPRFDEWYRFARGRNIYHLDDFDQINDDLRPFWSIPPAELRKLVQGLLAEDVKESSLGGVRVRNGKAEATDEAWRTTEFTKMINVFAKHLPDMDIAMNRLDQPRVVMPWEDLQRALAAEAANRTMAPAATNAFTKIDLAGEQARHAAAGALPTGGWFRASAKPYMDLVAPACPPESHARGGASAEAAAAAYQLAHTGGLVANFNRSSDLCTVGPALADAHGLLFAASTIVASRALVPVFGECKVNVNNDILFPANMYYKRDVRYEYAPQKDVAWDRKQPLLFWRGITSGGVQTADNWRRMHRHRFVQLTNATALALQRPPATAPILAAQDQAGSAYAEDAGFAPAAFAREHADVGFPEIVWCVPDASCGFLRPFFHEVSQTTLTDQFAYRYLVDVDGHSFSGRWNAFVKSQSLGIKATIFREWHDSRLFAWHHFAPLDNRFDGLYSLLTYFIGVDERRAGADGGGRFVPSHDREARLLAQQGRDWGRQVLRIEDMEIYTFRLMLEYARLLDDRRDSIGYGGDGHEVDEEKAGWFWKA